MASIDATRPAQARQDQAPNETDAEALRRLLSLFEFDEIYEFQRPRKHVQRSACLLLVHAHCLPSFLTLLRYLIGRFRFPPGNIILVPKPYSTINAVLDEIRSLGVTIVAEERNFRLES